MSTVKIEVQPRIKKVVVTDTNLMVELDDGRGISVPLTWYPRLAHATAEERAGWRVFEDSDDRDIMIDSWKEHEDA